MPNTYTVFANAVQLNGTNIPNLIAYEVSYKYNTESNASTGLTLAIRVKDVPSSAQRDNAIALAGAAYTALLAPEVALRPTWREFRPVAGDTVVFTSMTTQTAPGQYAPGAADDAGTDVI